MGLFEIKHFANGTIDIAKTMALTYWRGSKTLIGGGDTLEAMKRAGVSEGEVSHVSTGGGATLRFLAGDEMPGIDILEKSSAYVPYDMMNTILAERLQNRIGERMSANKILEGPWWDVVVVAVVVVVPQVFQHLPTPDVLTHRLRLSLHQWHSLGMCIHRLR